MDISVVIPVYGSARILEKLHARLIPVLETHASQFEVIFVEDCGPDDSWNVIAALAKQDNRIKGIKLNRNFGQHNALLCGIREARYPVIVTMDDDLQHPPEEIPKLLQELRGDCDVVYGAPMAEKHGLFRNGASILTKMILQNLMGATAARNVSAFRAFRTRLRDAFATYHSPVVSIDALLSWSTDRVSAIQVEHQVRADGASGYNFFRLLNHAFSLMTSFTVLPLRIASITGTLFLLFGFAILVWVLIGYLSSGGNAAPGFATLASMIAIFSGAQLFSLGIFGEYLARIHYKTMEQPAYVVKMIASADTPQD